MVRGKTVFRKVYGEEIVPCEKGIENRFDWVCVGRFR